jgi:hypothetical protein
VTGDVDLLRFQAEYEHIVPLHLTEQSHSFNDGSDGGRRILALRSPRWRHRACLPKVLHLLCARARGSRTNDDAAVHDELHVRSAARLHAGGGDVLGGV